MIFNMLVVATSGDLYTFRRDSAKSSLPDLLRVRNSTISSLLEPRPAMPPIRNRSVFAVPNSAFDPRDGLLVLALAAGLAACGPGHPQTSQVPEVGIVVLKPHPVPLTADLPGRTDPYATSDVRPQVTGILKSILFKEGGLVHAGQPLYQIDPAPYKAAYDSAKAALANAQAIW